MKNLMFFITILLLFSCGNSTSDNQPFALTLKKDSIKVSGIDTTRYYKQTNIKCDTTVTWDSVVTHGKPPVIVRQGIMNEWTFEKGIPLDLGIDGCCTYSIAPTKLFIYNGAGSLRFELDKKDKVKRCELNVPTAMAEPGTRIERWYGAAFLNDSSAGKDKSPYLVMQWHQSSGTASPPLALWIQSGEFKIAINGIAQKDVIGSAMDGIWHSFVFHVVWDPTPAGSIEVLKDGLKVFTRVNVATNYKNQSRGVYLKFGIYGWEYVSAPGNSTTTKRVVYIDDVRTGNELSNFNSVNPARQ